MLPALGEGNPGGRGQAGHGKRFVPMIATFAVLFFATCHLLLLLLMLLLLPRLHLSLLVLGLPLVNVTTLLLLLPPLLNDFPFGENASHPRFG